MNKLAQSDMLPFIENTPRGCQKSVFLKVLSTAYIF